jgi:hypothetical protein
VRAILATTSVLCACATSPASIDGFDVVVTPTSVTILAGYTSVDGQRASAFPDPGSCATGGEASAASVACALVIWIDGRVVARPPDANPADAFTLLAAIHDGAGLRASACGRTIEATISVQPVTGTIIAMRDYGMMDVNGASPAAMALIWETGDVYAGYGCLANASPYRFTGGDGTYFGLETIVAEDPIESELGAVRVWNATAASLIGPNTF